LEALIRWNHSKEVLIYPKEFIYIAEKYGLITSIDKLVLEMVCEQINKWVEMKINPINVSINISQIQFNDNKFVDTIDSIISNRKINPELLTLEIPETALIQDIDCDKENLKKIKERGISISLDDFGTKYSCLNYLKLLHLDTLKIDKSFVDEICYRKVDKSIVLLIINIAKILGIKTIAEGVETQDQLKLLNSLGCNEYQGYFFSKPVNAKEIGRILIKQK
jgi:EAL domain-containing protein (putative c-di-GMP-specific phosphodiesterase class I)